MCQKFFKILQNFAEILCGKIRMQLIEKKMCLFDEFNEIK
jgi:hypothetical protein